MLTEPASGAYVVLTVSDTGCGIAPEILGRIFEPFFTTKQPEKGTGLGLSTVATILKAHRGFAEVLSKQGEGTTFKIHFPSVDSDAAATKEERPSELPSGQGEWILLVDDEQALLEMSRVMLESFDYHILTASNGADAIRVYIENAQRISLLITDMMMPLIDGGALIKAAREIKQDLPVIVTSGLGSESKLKEAGELGISATLMKPFKVAELLKTIRRSIEGNGLNARRDDKR